MIAYLLAAALGTSGATPIRTVVAEVIEAESGFASDCNTCTKHISCLSMQHLIVAVSSEDDWQTNDPEEVCHSGWCLGQHSLCIPEDEDAIEQALLTDDIDRLISLVRRQPYGVVVDREFGVLQLRDCRGAIGAQYAITAKQYGVLSTVVAASEDAL